jgi:hypothetical protein
LRHFRLGEKPARELFEPLPCVVAHQSTSLRVIA